MTYVKDVGFIAMIEKVKLTENGLSILRSQFPKRQDRSLHRFSMLLFVRSCSCIRSRTTRKRSLLRAQGRGLEFLDDFSFARRCPKAQWGPRGPHHRHQ